MEHNLHPAPDADHGDIDAVAARIASQVAALREVPVGINARDAERALLADITRLAEWLRAETSAHGAALVRVVGEDAAPVSPEPSDPS